MIQTIYVCLILVTVTGVRSGRDISHCSNNYGLSFHDCSALYKIRPNCSDIQLLSWPPCYRVCHPEDCLRSTGVNGTVVMDVVLKLNCIVTVKRRSQNQECYCEADFERVSLLLLTEYNETSLLQNSSYLPSLLPLLSLPQNNTVYRVTRGAVTIPTTLHYRRFSICTKFVLAHELTTLTWTELAAFHAVGLYDENPKVFRIFVRAPTYIQVVYRGAAIFSLPEEMIPGKVISLCVSYRSSPRVQVAVWFRQEGGLLTRLKAVKIRPFLNTRFLRYTHLLGVLKLGDVENDYEAWFTGNFSSVKIFDEFMETKAQVLPYVRCETDSVVNQLQSTISGVLGMDSWASAYANRSTNSTTEPLETWTNGVELNGDAERLELEAGPGYEAYCGTSCVRCKASCMSASYNCTLSRMCASCEEMNCPGSNHYQLTYEDACSTKKLKCSVEALGSCFPETPRKGRKAACLELEDIIRCLERIDLDGCSNAMFMSFVGTYRPDPFDQFQPYEHCTLSDMMLNLLFAQGMSNCGEACTVDSGLKRLGVYDTIGALKMADNGELCEAVMSYRDCIQKRECAEKEDEAGMGHYQWSYSTVRRVTYLSDKGCPMPEQCSALVNSTDGQIIYSKVRQDFPTWDTIPKNPRVLEQLNRGTPIPIPTNREIKKCQRRAGRAEEAERREEERRQEKKDKKKKNKTRRRR